MAIAGPEDYIANFIPGGGGPASDIGTASDIGSLALAPETGGLSTLIGPLLSLIGGGASLGNLFGSLFGGGRSSTGPGSATADIASAASNSDPVLALLGEGAGSLPSGVPISSSSGAASGFGPYFETAAKLEDLLRWGPGGLTDPKAENATVATLKNALTGLGNPGQEGGTLQALQQAYQQGQEYLTPQNINLLMNQLNPDEQGILRQIIDKNGGGGGGRGFPNPNPNPNPNFPNPNPNFNLPTQGILNTAQLGSLLGLLGGGGGFSMGWYH